MSFVFLSSIGIQIVALVWSVVLLARLRDGRLAFLSAMLGVMLVRPGITLGQFETGLTESELAELLFLTVSVLAVSNVVSVGRMFHDRTGVGDKPSVKRADEEGRKTEALLRAAFESSTDTIFVKDLQSRYLLINAAATRDFGLSADRFIGKSDAELFEPETAQRILEEDRQLIAARSRQSKDERLETPGNGVRIFWTTKSVFTDTDGNVRGIFGITRDITERRRVEDKLKESRERFELAVRGATDGVWDANLVVGEMYVSDRWCELLGYQRDELPDASNLRQWWLAQVHPDDLESVNDAVRRHWALREPFGVDYRMRIKGSEYRWFSSRGQASWNLQGQAIRFAGCLTDITERRRAEAVIKQTHDRLDAILQTLPDLLFEVDSLGRIIDYRAKQEHLLAVAPARFLNRTFTEVLPADAAEACLEAIREAADKGIGRGKPYRLVLADGEHWFEVSVARKLGIDMARTTFIVLAREITDRMRTEASLQMERDRLRQILDAQFGFVCVLTLDGVLVEVNQTPLTLMGLSRADVLGRRVWDVGWPEPGTEPNVQAAIEAAARGETVRGDIAAYFPGLGRREVDSVLHPLRNKAGKVINVVAFGVDVTERKQMEAALVQSAELFRTLTQVAPVGIFRADLAGRCIYVNEYYSKISGRDCSTALGTGWLTSIHPDDRDRILTEWTYAVEARVPFLSEVRFQHPDGKVVWIIVRARSEMGTEKQVLGFVGSLTDITERKIADTERRTNEERLQVGLTTANVAVFSQDRRLRYTWMFQPQMGYTSEQVIGRTDAELLPPEAAQDVMKIKHRVIEEGINVHTQFPIRTGDQTFIFDLIVRPLRDVNGSIVGLTGASLDVTEQKRTESELRVSRDRLEILSRQLITAQEAERKNLARELHDEIGQSLTVMRILCETGADSTDSRILDLVTDLMERVRNLSFDLRPPMLDPLGLFPTLLWKFDQYLELTGIRVNFQHSGVEGRFTPELEIGVYRIIQEALTNVARHAGVTEASVQIWADEDTLGIQVADRGQGFNPDAVMAAGQTGGLIGIQERVQCLGGDMAIESTPGQGTFLTVQFPLVPPPR